MTARALLLPLALITATAVACVKPINDGNACFQSTECHGGSVCAATVYGKYCMKRCDVDTVRCEPDFEACLLSSDAGFGGVGGDSGLGGMGGAAGAGGTGTGPDIDAGPADPDAEEIWVCLPGRLENPNYFPRVRDQICEFSIDCGVGLVCVCTEGATCTGEDGPTCQEVCDPDVVSLICPDQRPCIDLGNGRGYCEPLSSP